MARAELAKARPPKLRALAQSIISDQTRENGEMNAWRIKWYGAPVPPEPPSRLAARRACSDGSLRGELWPLPARRRRA